MVFVLFVCPIFNLQLIENLLLAPIILFFLILYLISRIAEERNMNAMKEKNKYQYIVFKKRSIGREIFLGMR